MLFRNEDYTHEMKIYTYVKQSCLYTFLVSYDTITFCKLYKKEPMQKHIIKDEMFIEEKKVFLLFNLSLFYKT